jgi:hypothetical protein
MNSNIPKHWHSIKKLFIPAMFALPISHISTQTIQNQEMIKPRKQATLPEGHIFLPHEPITIVKDMWNGQRRIHLEISSTYVREREIHVFLKPEADEIDDLITGTYELFLTGSSLALTNRATGKKIVFEINEEPGVLNTHIQHGNAQLVHAIGIARYFKTCPRR